MSAAPRITVGIPVFNGAATIAASIAAFTAQTCGDFELIISDNASTDGPRASVESLAARDGRIRYLRQATNIGANLNYSQVAMLDRGEFLKWASASDADAMLMRCWPSPAPACSKAVARMPWIIRRTSRSSMRLLPAV